MKKPTTTEFAEVLRACIGMLERADCSTGCCCCGSPVDSHGIGDGHSPVDAGNYHQEQALEAARAILARLEKPRTSDLTRAALAEVERGAAVAPTARKYGIQPSTLFRARARLRAAAERREAPTPSPAARRSAP